MLHAGWAAVVVAVVLGASRVRPSAAVAAPAANPRPVIVLMDSPLPGRVYDARTLERAAPTPTT